MKTAKEFRDRAMEKGFSGALFWTMDSFEQTALWHLMEDGGKYLAEFSLLPGKQQTK